MNVVKWGILGTLAVTLIGIIVTVFTNLDAVSGINSGIDDVVAFIGVSSSYIRNWREVLNIFCNPLILNIGFLIWLMYPVYSLLATLTRKAITFIFR